jgi:hypothetical protein
MKRAVFYINILAILFISCGQQESKITLEDLQGDWTAYGGGYDVSGSYAEVMETDPVTYEIRNWRIKGDSLWSFNCLCELNYKGIIEIKENTIYIDGDDYLELDEHSVPDYTKISIEDGELIIEEVNESIDSDWKEVYYYYFKKDTFDSNTVRPLINDSINWDCLVGKMNIVTHFEPDDEAPFDVTFPIEIPEQLIIEDTHEAKSIFESKKIMLMIDNKERAFSIEEYEWDYLKRHSKYPKSGAKVSGITLYLKPLEWWKGEKFRVVYKSDNL